MGWPLFAAGVIGLSLAVASPRQRRMTVWLLVPAVSYYVGFIDVILYNYDRFVLPMCLVLAMFGGFAFDRVLSAGGACAWRARGGRRRVRVHAALRRDRGRADDA